MKHRFVVDVVVHIFDNQAGMLFKQPQGFRSDFVCTPTATSMSWGGKRCEFDWGHPLSQEEVKELAEKKAKLGTSCMKDFNFHTAHLKYTVSQALILNLGEKGEEAVKLALADYVDTFGQEYLDVLNGLYPVE